jgi:WD40 repeat protein
MLDHKAHSFSTMETVDGLAWSPDGSMLAVTQDSGSKLSLVDERNGRALWNIDLAHGAVSPVFRVVEFSPDGTTILAAAPAGRKVNDADRDQAALLLSSNDGSVLRAFRSVAPRSGTATAVAAVFSGQGTRAFVVARGALTSIVAYDNNAHASEFLSLPGPFHETPAGLGETRLAVDARRGLLWWAREGILRSIDLQNAKVTSRFEAFSLFITALAVNPETGDIVAGGSADIRGVPAADRTEIKSYQDDPTTLVRAFSAGGSLVRTYRGPGGSVQGVTVSRDGRYVAAAKARSAGRSPSYILLWDARSGELISSKDCGNAEVGDVAFDASGTRLAFSIDNRVWISELPNR